jgi:hypothetical protein
MKSLRKIFSVCRLERLGLLELLQRLRERIDKSGRNARFAEADMRTVASITLRDSSGSIFPDNPLSAMIRIPPLRFVTA